MLSWEAIGTVAESLGPSPVADAIIADYREAPLLAAVRDRKPSRPSHPNRPARSRMDSIDLIRENLRRSEDIVLARVEDMREYGLVFPTPRGGCHTVWTLGHLAYIESLVIQDFMLGHRNPLGHWEALFDGADVSGDVDRFPSFDAVLEECRTVRASTTRLVDSLTETDMDRSSANVPEGAAHLFGTYRACLQYAADHWFMHRGQLADARRAAGVDRMWF